MLSLVLEHSPYVNAPASTYADPHTRVLRFPVAVHKYTAIYSVVICILFTEAPV